MHNPAAWLLGGRDRLPRRASPRKAPVSREQRFAPGVHRKRRRPIKEEVRMSATGLDVFDKTLQTTHTWLDEIMRTVGPDRQVAWHVLGAVLRVLRDRLPVGLAAHLGAQLPILVRGVYYDQWRGSEQ